MRLDFGVIIIFQQMRPCQYIYTHIISLAHFHVIIGLNSSRMLHRFPVNLMKYDRLTFVLSSTIIIQIFKLFETYVTLIALLIKTFFILTSYSKRLKAGKSVHDKEPYHNNMKQFTPISMAKSFHPAFQSY